MERTYGEMMKDALEAAKACTTGVGSKWQLRFNVETTLCDKLSAELGTDYDVDGGRHGDNVAAKSIWVKHIPSGATIALRYNMYFRQAPKKSYYAEYTLKDLVMDADENAQAAYAMKPSERVNEYLKHDLAIKQRDADKLQERKEALAAILKRATEAIENGEPVGIDTHKLKYAADKYNESLQAAYVVKSQGGK